MAKWTASSADGGIGIGPELQAVVVIGDLLRRSEDLPISINAVLGFDEGIGLPGDALRRRVRGDQEDAQGDGGRGERGQPFRASAPKEHGDGEDGSPRARRAPIGKQPDEDEIRKDSGERGAEGFPGVRPGHGAGRLADGDERPSQGEIDEERRGQGEEEDRSQPDRLARQEAQDRPRGPEQDESDGRADQGQQKEAAETIGRVFPLRRAQAPQPAPQEPGGEDEPVDELVAVELGPEFAEEEDLDAGGRRAESESRRRRTSGPSAGDRRSGMPDTPPC